MSVRLTRLALLLLLSVATSALAGCGGAREVTGGRDWTTAVSRTDGSTYTVTVHDESGIVNDAQVDPPNVPVPNGVEVAQGKPSVILLRWVGGTCDTLTAIDIKEAAGGLAVKTTITKAPGTCDLMAVPHVLQLTLAKAIPPAAVTLVP